MHKRTIWAVFAGVLVTVVATTLVDIGLQLVGVFPSMDQLLTDKLPLLAAPYRNPIGIGAAWLTARLPPNGHPTTPSFLALSVHSQAFPAWWPGGTAGLVRIGIPLL